MTSQALPLAPVRALDGGKIAIQIEFAGLALTLDRSGAAHIGGVHNTLIVADLHLEKGSGAAAGGCLLPALDSHDTLLRLERTIETYRPERVICLGDSFHDASAGNRMAAADKEQLSALSSQIREWIWLSGNHDPEVPAFCGGETRAAFNAGGVTLRHEPSAARAEPQIAGHLHPKASLAAGGYRLSGPCFCLWDDLLILPAFGAYTGGLSCSAYAIRSLHTAGPKIYMLHASKLWRVA
ncbi:MAG: ligase-associated DNA damage response endonuclease PdeM [Rhodomicrobium sp.]